ncbi:MAG: glycosyltransferase family 2 protein [Gaiellaceae bacterium]
MDRRGCAARRRQNRRVDGRAYAEGARHLSANDGGQRETLSVVIPSKNSAHLLDRCLASVAWADEIILVDMHSTDGTDACCARFPQCRVLQRDGYIEENVNYGFEQATGSWIMRLDTDEVLTAELAHEVQEILQHPPEGVTGFEFWERPIMLGRELRHGFGQRHHRKMLFRRGTARYPAQSYHEDFETTGVWRQAEHGYLHFNYDSVSDYLRKIDFYTRGDIERVTVPTRRPSAFSGLRESARAFYLYYLRRQGFRDGWVGLVDAAMRGFYQFVYWSKLRERWERDRETVQ